MATINASGESSYTQRIDRFGGVDFTTSATQVKAYRSPDAVNMIADEKFFPVKRAGYEKLRDYAGRIYGIHFFDGHTFVHAGNTLYLDGETPTALYTSMGGHRSCGFIMGDALFLLDGTVYLRVTKSGDGYAAAPVKQAAYVPTTSISRTPAGAGTAFEAVNLLSAWRVNSFVGDGVATVYQLDGTVDSVEYVKVAGEALTPSTDYTVDSAAGTVTFTTAPADGDGVDNVIIRYLAQADSSDVINACTICGVFGGENDSRVFLTGNAAQKNVDWQSGLYDPTYFPDTGYTKIGSDSSAIMGYARHYDAQVVIKQDGAQDATQWLRTFEIDADGRAKFPVAQGAYGAGAYAVGGFAQIGDLPLFLAKTGVHAIYGTAVDSQRNLRCVSAPVNKKLTAESTLSDCCAVTLMNKAYFLLNGHVYIADGAQRYTDSQSSYQYEWYYWEGIPAVCAATDGERLYFGTEGGMLCRMKDRNAVGAFTDNGEEYSCHWSTPMFELGTLYRTKTIRDVAFMLMCFSHGQYKIYYRSSKRDWELIKEGSTSLLDWDDVDFNDFSFSGLWAPEMSRTKRKERKVEAFQLKVVNDKADTNLGILGLELIYKKSARVK